MLLPAQWLADGNIVRDLIPGCWYKRDMELPPISDRIWDSKYRWRRAGIALDADLDASWQRVAGAAAAVEDDAGHWHEAFLEILRGFRFLPGGRILAGAGTGRINTLFNCFVMGTIEDSMDGIFQALKEGALTLQQGGGVGYDFSSLRPRGAVATATGTIASGPVSFMAVWDAMCATLLSTGARRGAMMATLRCDHPDILEFIQAKHQDRLSHFNLSVLVTDRFMEAVREDREWPLQFPILEGEHTDAERISADLGQGEVACRVYRRLPARDIWQTLVHSAWETAEPGVVFVDRVNDENNLRHLEHISATNPCGEVPLPPYGSCDLGSVNLAAMVRQPFTAQAVVDEQLLDQVVQVAVRFMDNIVDVSPYPLSAQQAVQHGRRRLGLGITGLADCLVMLGLRYDSPEGRNRAGALMRRICLAAYRASVALAAEKGPYPLFDAEICVQAPFIRRLPAELQQAIADTGLRNSHLLALAPAGTISLLAGNVSSGIEPIFSPRFRRRMLEGEGQHEYVVEDFACRLWSGLYPGQSLPAALVTAAQVSPMDHVLMQAALQDYVDNAISKTINLPASASFDSFNDIFQVAWEKGLKGCTVFRPGTVRGQVLRSDEDGERCCGVTVD